MKLVIPFHNGDIKLAIGLLEWMEELSTKKSESAILVFPHNVNKKDLSRILTISDRLFRYYTPYMLDRDIKSWPAGPNQMFLEAIKYIHGTMAGSFLWLEPDATPLVVGWFDRIKEAYKEGGMPFMGSVNVRVKDSFAHFSGVGVYPENAYTYWKNILPNNQPFDMINQDVVVPLVHKSPLIKNFWGDFDLPPTFKAVKTKTDSINTLTLNNIPKEAVLFHRVKDGSLVQLLRKIYDIRKS